VSIGHYTSARDQVAAVRERRISARELLELHLARIDEVNPQVNALVSVDPERAMQTAASADARQARGEPLGALHGLPFAVKDTHHLTGWRTTFGSPTMADHVSTYDDLHVGAGAGCGGGAGGEVERAGVRSRIAHVQPDLRHDAQPL
jgi:amidase